MNKFIKTSLVMASLMGAITLNAWHCNHCNRDHRGRVCPATGHTQDTQYFGCGDPYGCWRMDVDSDDAAAAIQNMNTTMQVMLQRTQEVMQRQHRQARAQISSRVLQTFQVFDDPGVSPLWVAPTVPLVGHMPKGTPVFGPIQKLYSREGDYIYKAKNGMNVVNIKGLWLYECYMQGSQNFTTMFAGDGGEFY
ncbi:MAG: hypothetical protein LBE99_00680, partial [Puniceicoccales bacterium]|nr:hypothetical protein [Puniceicoccales bacterium]